MGLVSRYPDQWLAVAFHGMNLVLIRVAICLHWLYAIHHPRLVGVDLTSFVRRFATQRFLLAPAYYQAAIILRLINPFISLLVFALVPILYIVPAFQMLWLWLRLARH